MMTTPPHAQTSLADNTDLRDAVLKRYLELLGPVDTLAVHLAYCVEEGLAVGQNQVGRGAGGQGWDVWV